jgi:hypothetical protein
MLLDAERIAPQLVRYDTATHDLLTLLLRREHRGIRCVDGTTRL